MDATELRKREHVLATEYDVAHLPPSPDDEDLRVGDVGHADNWMQVYAELVDFDHSLHEPASEGSPEQQRAIALQAKVHELHLAFWTERSIRSRINSSSG